MGFVWSSLMPFMLYGIGFAIILINYIVHGISFAILGLFIFSAVLNSAILVGHIMLSSFVMLLGAVFMSEFKILI